MAKPRSKAPQPSVIELASRAALAALTLALLLAAYNLWLTIGSTGELSGLTQSWETLRSNYGLRVSAPAPAKEEEEPVPVVLWSMARYRDGEPESLQSDLLGPVLAHYDGAENGLRAVLIERKNAGSRDVNVRLFFADGSETAYLWPSTHSDEEGRWINEE